MVAEIWRALEPGGILFAVYMAVPTSTGGRIWAWLFRHLRFLSRGCYPVSIVPCLTGRAFRILKDIRTDRLGFPIRYVVSEKPAEVCTT